MDSAASAGEYGEYDSGTDGGDVPDDVLNNVKRYVRNGSIITFHDSLKSIDKLHYALPEAIKWLKLQGYEFKIFD